MTTQVTGRDDSNEFYGDTDIIDGMLDCNAWGPGTGNLGGIAAQNNDGSAGDGVIGVLDDCTLIGYDGTADGVTIAVTNGVFDWPDGPLPTVFNAADPDNPDVGASDFAWSAIRGRVDSNGNEFIDPDDCHFGIVGPADILGSSATCGFATTPAFADNGLVDLNGNGAITAADSCSNGCFFGYDVSSGFVLKMECPGFEGDPRNDVVGTAGSETLVGTAGARLRWERHPQRAWWQRPPARWRRRGRPQRPQRCRHPSGWHRRRRPPGRRQSRRPLRRRRQ